MAKARGALSRGDFAEAEAKYILALGAMKAGANRVAYVDTLTGLGDAEFGLGRFRDSHDSYYRAMQQMAPMAQFYRDKTTQLRERLNRAWASAATEQTGTDTVETLSSDAMRVFSEDIATGMLTHRTYNLRVPKEVAGWRRAKVAMLREDGADFFVRYRSTMKEFRGGFTIYVEPGTGRPLSEQVVAYLAEIKNSSRSASLPQVRAVKFEHNGAVREGYVGLLSRTAQGAQQSSIDTVYMFQVADRIMAVRASFDAQSTARAPEALERAIEAFWFPEKPQGKGPKVQASLEREPLPPA